jgi:hypothetical protein
MDGLVKGVCTRLGDEEARRMVQVDGQPILIVERILISSVAARIKRISEPF